MFAKIATIIAVSVAAGSFLETSVAAQPSLTSPARERRPYARKSERTATLLSIAGTVIPIGIYELGARGANSDENDTLMAAGVVGLLFAPSAGHLYATGNLRSPGLLIRSVGMLTGMVGMSVLLFGEVSCGVGEIVTGSPRSTPCDNNASEGNAILGVGTAVLVGGAIYDIATASSTTRRANARRWALAPTLLRSNNQAPTVGLALSGAF